jgi:enterochelin esterase-like enzyme
MTLRLAVPALVSLALVTTANVSAAGSLPTMPPDGYDKGGRYPAGKVEELTYHSSVTNSDRKMEVYTPPGYSPSEKYPAIYAIHGIGAWPDTIFADWCVGAAFVSDNLLGEKKIRPTIIVAMDDNDVDTHRELFDAIIPYVESKYPVIADADHRGIYGYSMGGGATFAEGIGNLDTFHHISPSSATPFNHPSDADMFPNGGAEAKQKIKTLFISCGTADWDGFYPPNEATHKYCEANGIPHSWLSVEGGGHDGGVWRPAMWNFLQLAFPAGSDADADADADGGADGRADGGTRGDGGKVGTSDAGTGGRADGGATARDGGVDSVGGDGAGGSETASSSGCASAPVARGPRALSGILGVALGVLAWGRRRRRI